MTRIIQLDLTDSGEHHIEVLTPAGIVRITSGITETGTGRPRVAVEAELNTGHQHLTAPGGAWVAEEIMRNGGLVVLGLTEGRR